MKQVAVDKIIAVGTINGNIKEGEQIFFDTPIKIESGIIESIQGNKVTITYQTLKTNIHGHDITPKINFDYFDENEDHPHLVDIKEIYLREPTQNEYEAINEFLKKEYNDDEKYTDIERHRINVHDVTDDFKIINYDQCSIYKWSNGKETVHWDTYRYAYKHGFIYPYNNMEESDDCVEDLGNII